MIQYRKEIHIRWGLLIWLIVSVISVSWLNWSNHQSSQMERWEQTAQSLNRHIEDIALLSHQANEDRHSAWFLLDQLANRLSERDALLLSDSTSTTSWLAWQGPSEQSQTYFQEILNLVAQANRLDSTGTARLQAAQLDQLPVLADQLAMTSAKLCRQLEADRNSANTWGTVFFSVFVGLLIGYGALLFFWSDQLIQSIIGLNNFFAHHFQISRQDYQGSEVELLTKMAGDVARDLDKASAFAVSIGNGHVDLDVHTLNLDSPLGKALADMHQKLWKVAKEEEKQDWAMSGLATVNDILADHQQMEINQMTYAFAKALVQHLGVVQGAVFVIEPNPKTGEMELFMSECYAYERHKFIQKRLPINEGLLGQCIQEKQRIYLDKIPEGYVHITSGLGEALPKYVLIVPIQSNGQAFGAIELASFHQIEAYQIDYVEAACEKLGLTLSNIQSKRNTEKLLEEAKRANADLIATETIMRENTEELFLAQSNLSKKMVELEEEANLIRRIFEAIDKISCSIEFDMQSNIIAVNSTFCNVMGYQQDELIGQHERLLLPYDEEDSTKHKIMWQSLREGAFIEGEFKRLAKNGKIHWFKGTYNPILDLNNQPTKIIQLVQVTTEEKERDFRIRSKMNGIQDGFAQLEIDMNGLIKKTNQTFTQHFGFQQREIRNSYLSDFLHFIQDDGKAFERLWNKVLTERSYTEAIQFRSHNGQVKYTIANFTLIKKLDGESEMIFLTLAIVPEVLTV